MLEWLAELKPEARESAITRAFDNTFSSEDSMIVLGIMLRDLRFMDEARDAGERALNNYAKMFLKQCGTRIASQAIEAWLRVTSKPVGPVEAE